jgi:hypothetical protein
VEPEVTLAEVDNLRKSQQLEVQRLEALLQAEKEQRMKQEARALEEKKVRED